MVTDINTGQPIVNNDLNKNILAQYDGDPNFITEWFICSSAASFCPKPGSGARKAKGSGGEDILTKPLTADATTIATSIFDPDCNYVIEFDPQQINTCSCVYEYGDRVPAINLRRCRGAVLRNVIVASTVMLGPYDADYTQFGFIAETTGSMGVAYFLQESELITASAGSLVGAIPLQNTSYTTVSVIYAPGSRSVFFKNLAKLVAKYYVASVLTEQRVVMEVL